MPKDSVIAVTRPCPATSVASVTRKGVIRSQTMQNALIAPKIAPVSEPDDDASAHAEAVLQRRDLEQVADVIADTYMFEPTERSMPAVSSTKVMPTAMTPMKDACLTMLRMFSALKKFAALQPEE